ncbi:MAG TPA: hypothetical protein DDW65_02495 [Firmicutes bacterium]|nr:hypothetical protein [Bacillota bacterium]
MPPVKSFVFNQRKSAFNAKADVPRRFLLSFYFDYHNPCIKPRSGKYIAIFLKRRRKIGRIGFSTESGKMLIDALLKVICRIHDKFIIQSLALSLFYFWGISRERSNQ